MIQSEKEIWLKKILFVKEIVLIIISFVFVPSLVILVMKYFDNKSIGFIEILPVILLCPVFFLAEKFFRSYEQTITQLSESDLAEIKSKNASSRKWRKYFPAFIISSDHIRVFQGAVQPIYYFKNITEIQHCKNSSPGGVGIYVIKFKTLKGENLNFKVHDEEEQNYLIKKITAANHNIRVQPMGNIT